MKIKRLIQNLLLAILSLVIFLLIAESTTFLLWDYKHQHEKEHVCVVVKEGNKRVVNEDIEYITNSLGLRERELDKRPKAKKTTPVAMETVTIDSEFLTKAVELLILMSPTYPGFPSLTLAEKIQKGDYNLSHHEQLFLVTTLEALQSVSFDLRLNDLSALIKEVKTRITNSQLTFVREQEAKESLSF